MASNNKQMSPFEANRKKVNRGNDMEFSTDESDGQDAAQSLLSLLGKKEDIFEKLIASGEELDRGVTSLIAQVNEIMIKHKIEFDKNFTFSILFNSIKQFFSEYKAQTTLFDSYSKTYESLCNEENLVKILDILREILKERKSIINDVINNIIKIQKLSNDRIKIDMGTDNDDITELLDPDEM